MCTVSQNLDEVNELLLDVISQARGNDDGYIYDSGLSAYEAACSYLEDIGRLIQCDPRFGHCYKITGTGDETR